MDAIFRVGAMYLFLLLAFRVAGKRALSEATTFDLLLLLIISETTQQALVGEDHSITNAFLLIISFLAIEVFLSVLKQRFKKFDDLLEGHPLVLINNGICDSEAMKRAHVDVDDVLEAARGSQGIEQLSMVKFAILERTGDISIIPFHPSPASRSG
jgi:uncharacterized membrane protein YcaP (DUF421 family)